MTHTLLIVDDDPAIREVFSILLTEQGYSVHAVPGGRECLDILTSVVPDLIMLDIMMYPLDGWDTLSSIRKNPKTEALPAIMFSGKSPSFDEISQYGRWIDDYLMKPISMPTIHASIEAIFVRVYAALAERSKYLELGADPGLIDEYFALRRFLFIHSKFSREIQKGQKNADTKSLPQRVRFEELDRLLTPMRLPVSDKR